jgi:hypothetical protein
LKSKIFDVIFALKSKTYTMKKLNFLIIILLFVIPLTGQNCEHYYPSKPGTSWEITNYDGRNKVQSVGQSTVISKEEIPGGEVVTISAVTVDNKNKETTPLTYTTLCKDGKFVIDMRAFMNPETLGGADINMQFEAENMEIPSKLSIGQKLPDSWIRISLQAEGTPVIMNQTISMTNRTVEGFEEITTPAGTFNCVKITFETEMKSMFSIRNKTISWYSIDVGLVRSETFDMKGKPQGYSELTKFNK